jgi:hypothetical protein
LNDHHESDVGKYAGWGTGDDANPPPKSSPPERTQLLYAWRYREDNVWRDRLVWLWVPAMILLITIEDWLHVPQLVGWLSIGALFVVFLVVAWLTDRIDTT